MSSTVSVLCMKCSIMGKTEDMYGMLAYDNYGVASDIGYPTYEEFMKSYPTIDSIVDWLSTQPGFEGSEYALLSDENREANVIPVVIEGYIGH